MTRSQKSLKKELEGRIIEYSLCKQAAQTFREVYVGDLVFIRTAIKLPVNKTYTREHDPQCLYDAYMGISKKARESVSSTHLRFSFREQFYFKNIAFSIGSTQNVSLSIIQNIPFCNQPIGVSRTPVTTSIINAIAI